MTRHPELQVKFREYIRGALSEEALTSPGWDDLTPNKTPYLEAMIYETLRYGMIAVFARRGESSPRDGTTLRLTW